MSSFQLIPVSYACADICCLHNNPYCGKLKALFFICGVYDKNLRFCQLQTVPCLLMFLQLGFTLLALIWEYDFPPFMVLIIAILNDGKVMSVLLASQ